MPQLVVARLAPRREFHDLVDHPGDIVRGLDVIARDIDDAGLHHLALEQGSSSSGTLDCGIRSRPAGSGSGRSPEDLLILPPLAAERLLPVGVGLDAVAIADVNGRGAGQALRGAPAP